MISFDSPLYLLALPLALILALSSWWISRGSPRNTLRSFIVTILRVLTLTSLAISLSSPYREHKAASDTVEVLADISRSISDDAFDRSMQKIKNLAGNLPVKVRGFAKSQTAESDQIPTTLSSAFSGGENNKESTNIAEALRSVSSSSVKLVTLFTDGNETDGNALEAAKELASQGIRIFPVYVEDSENSEAGGLSISQLTAPLIASAQKSVAIQTSIKNSSSVEQKGTLTISHGDKKISTQQLSIGGKKEDLFSADSDPSLEGLNEITATLDWTDKRGKDHHDTRTVFLSGEQREKVLLVNGSPEEERILSPLLKSQAYQLTSLTAGDKPLTLPPLNTMAVVIFNNIPNQLTVPGTAASIKEYVNSGGSFIMIGGDRSFGLGGYIKTPIEEVLPVDLVPPQTEKKRLNLAVQLVIDKSRSMASDSKLDFARTAAVEVVKNLKDDDYVGVIGFDNAPFIALPIGRLAENRSSAEDRINRLFATGRTNLFPAIDEARRGLIRVNAGRKHIIILTDGKIPDSGPYYLELIKQVRTLGITVSTVLLGDEADDSMLKEMAEVGGGSYYQTADAQNLPRIFLSDVKVSSGEQTLKEKMEYNVRRGPSSEHTVSIDDFPSLLGYVETKPKERANLELVVMAEAIAEPLLAWWKFGQGKSFAFTSDSNGRWSSKWVGWSRFGEFWSDIITSARQKNSAQKENVKFDLRSFVAERDLNLDLSVFSDEVAGTAKAQLKTPSGVKRTVSFTQKAAGRYEAVMEKAEPGKYTLDITVGNKQLPSVGIYLPGELFGEQKNLPPNWALLSKLASITGGRLNPDSFATQDMTSPKNVKYDLSFPFLALAVLTYLLEIAARELLKFRGRRLMLLK